MDHCCTAIEWTAVVRSAADVRCGKTLDCGPSDGSVHCGNCSVAGSTGKFEEVVAVARPWPYD